MAGYFSSFPTIVYNDALVTNVIARVKIDTLIRNKKSVFYPYTVSEGERPDTIAYFYYGDPKFAWLIYYANEIVDPYFEWPLSQKEFQQFLVNKYGSVELAQEKTLFYRVNWAADESMLNVAGYNSLTSSLKKYWQPVYDYRGQVVSYERKQVDWSVETNKVVQLTHNTSTISDIFSVGDQIKQKSGSTITAKGFVKYTSATTIVVEKIEGEFVTGLPVKNYEETVNVTITAVDTITQPLSDLEAVYWSPVTAFDYEDELNESRKHIYLIDKTYLDQIELEMKSLLL